MAQTLQQLAQARPANTTAASILTVSASTEALVKTIIVANTSSSSAKFRIFHDDDGTTYSEATALAWDILVEAGSMVAIETNICMNDSSGNLAVRTDTASALTFTAYGSIVT